MNLGKDIYVSSDQTLRMVDAALILRNGLLTLSNKLISWILVQFFAIPILFFLSYLLTSSLKTIFAQLPKKIDSKDDYKKVLDHISLLNRTMHSFTTHSSSKADYNVYFFGSNFLDRRIAKIKKSIALQRLKVGTLLNSVDKNTPKGNLFKARSHKDSLKNRSHAYDYLV